MNQALEQGGYILALIKGTESIKRGYYIEYFSRRCCVLLS